MNRIYHTLLSCLLLVAISTAPLSAKDVWVTSAADSGVGSLRTAIDEAVDGDIVHFDAKINGVPILLDSSINIVSKQIRIVGNGVGKTIISGNERTRVIHIWGRSDVSISGVSIVDGYANNFAGIYINRSDLKITDFLIENNYAYGRDGGGIGAQIHVHLTMRNGVIANNSAKVWAGGFYALNSWVKYKTLSCATTIH